MIYPSDSASYVWTLSGGCITEDTLRYLLWDLPLKIGNQLLAASLVNLPMQQGLKLVKLDEGNVTSDVARLEEIVKARMLAQGT